MLNYFISNAFVYFLIFITFVIALILTPVVIKLSKKLGIVDIPDDERRVHKKPMPRVGGIAIVVAVFIGLSIYCIITKNIESLALGKGFYGYLIRCFNYFFNGIL
ncbi:MAG: hypothetical protein RSE41_03485 [Clostridia bacterium]